MYPRGLSLLEILVVLLVVGVITALSLPAYRQHLVRVHRGEAAAALYEIAAAEERFHLRHGLYTSDLVSAAPRGLGLSALSSARRYALSVALAADAQTFIANATPTHEGGQADDGQCLVFSIDQGGRRAVSGTRDTAFCWR
jgi:type IV pilus assembly protein PilE